MIHPSSPAAVLLASSLGLLIACSPGPGSSAGWPAELRAEPVPLYGDVPPAEGSRSQEIGQLRYRAGFHLTAGRSEFGGFSGLALSAGGRRLTAVSDRGWWLDAELVHDPAGTLAGFGASRMGPLLDDDGRPVSGRDRRDAEELVALPGGRLLVTFEAHHRAHVYGSSPPSGAPGPVPHPPGIDGFPENQGMEAAAFLGGARGRLLVLAEHVPEGGAGIAGWLAEVPDGKPQGLEWRSLSLAPTGDFQPTGAATLPSGDVLLLERSYSPQDGTRVRLSRIDGAAVAAGTRLEPRELARLEPPITLDNMEAVATRRGPAGETLIYLLSDDNYAGDQRTLLLQFELLPAGFRAP